MTTPKLQHELKKKRPFESLEEEAALNIVRTSDQLQIRFARLLREYGLTSPTQYNILRILRGEGQAAAHPGNRQPHHHRCAGNYRPD